MLFRSYNVVATDTNGCEVEAAVFNVMAAVPSTVNREPFTIFPNPVENYLILKMEDVIFETAIEVTIYDVFGKRVYSAACCEQPTVDCELLQSGLYYLEVKSSGKIFRGKFVKQ